ncbi:uncharacterized protein LOC108093392 [Drosophila ficusphila]|uniref:uncharacterized protein LOC108093392 n=1 Tax=Drosophila ficusphila TaxID=30025 RepID=UPI0007E8B0F7|nr:uncharacterized protein LOC108093392 [Drosophila ficusphila]
MENFSRRSPYSQIGIGAAVGFLSGFAVLKARKIVALTAGGAILGTLLALEAGIVQLDLLRIGSLTEHVRYRWPHRMEARLRRAEELGVMAKKAIVTSGRVGVAFLAGFLLGFGFA